MVLTVVDDMVHSRDSIKKEIGKLSESGGAKVKSCNNARKEVECSRVELEHKESKLAKTYGGFEKRKIEVESRLERIDAEYSGLSDQATALKDKLERKSRKKTDATSSLLQIMMQPIHNFTSEWTDIKAFHRRHSEWNLPAEIGRGWISKIDRRRAMHLWAGDGRRTSASHRFKH